MSGLPWMKFYPNDWRSEPTLRICSLSARGLWIELLGLMHEATPRGHLLICGLSPTDAQLAALVGILPEQLTELVGELETARVFSRTSKGVIYSRRMTKDEKKIRTAVKNGKNGGNPSLCNKRKNKPLDNPKDKGGVKLRSQKSDKEKDIPNGISKKFPVETERKPYAKRDKTLNSELGKNRGLPTEYREYAQKWGHPNPELEWEMFINFWESNGKTKINWLATWRNRVINSRKNGWYTEKNYNSSNSNRSSRGSTSAILDLTAEIVAERCGEET